MDIIIKDAYLLAVTLIAWISKSKSGRWYFLYVYPTKGSNQKSIKKSHKFITKRNKNERNMDMSEYALYKPGYPNS